MLPRGLTGRIVLAFVALAAAVLIGIAGSLFVVLRELHQTEIKDSLVREATAISATLGSLPVGQWEASLRESGSSLADEDGFIMFKGPATGIRVLAGNPI